MNLQIKKTTQPVKVVHIGERNGEGEAARTGVTTIIYPCGYIEVTSKHYN